MGTAARGIASISAVAVAVGVRLVLDVINGSTDSGELWATPGRT